MLISLSSLGNIYYYLTSVMDNKSLRLITDASVSSPVSREKSQGLDPSMRGRPDGFTGILIAFDSCLLRGLFLHFCRQSYLFVSKFWPQSFPFVGPQRHKCCWLRGWCSHLENWSQRENTAEKTVSQGELWLFCLVQNYNRWYLCNY
jgi:hypothetical protein